MNEFPLSFFPLQASAHQQQDASVHRRRVRGGAGVRREAGGRAAGRRTQDLLHLQGSLPGESGRSGEWGEGKKGEGGRGEVAGFTVKREEGRKERKSVRR